MRRLINVLMVFLILISVIPSKTMKAAETQLNVISGVSSSAYSSSYTCSKAYDNNTETLWISEYTAPEKSSSEYLNLEVGASSVTKVVLTPRADGIGYPLQFRFQTSCDGVNFVDIPGSAVDVSGIPINSIKTAQTYTFSQAVLTKYIRLYVTKKGVDGWDVVQLVEMMVYGESASAWTDETVFSENFSSNLSAWTAVSGVWSVENGELSQSDIGTDRQLTVNGTFNQNRIRIESTFQFITDVGSAEIMFRRAGGLDHNSIKLDAANNKISIWLNGKNFSNSYPINAATVYTVKVELNGSNIKFYINNVVVLERDDNPNPETGNIIGLNSSGAHIHFDNFTVKTINNWDRQWSTLISSSKIEKKGADRLYYANYQYPYIGLAGTTMFAGPNGFTTPNPPNMDLTLNSVNHSPLLLYDYWWDGTTRISPFGFQGGYGQLMSGTSIEDGIVNGDNFSQILDVGTGVLTTELNITVKDKTFNTKRTQFINPQGVLVYKIEDSNTNDYFKLKIFKTNDIKYNISYFIKPNGLLAKISYGTPTKYAYLSVVCSGTVLNTDLTNGIITCSKGTSLAPLYFYIAPSSSLNESDAGTAAYNRALTASGAGYAVNLINTTSWWNEYYMKSSINIPDLGSAKWYVRSLYYNAVAIAGSRIPPGCYATNPAGFFGNVCPEYDLVFSQLALLYSNHSDTSKSITDWLEAILPKVEELATNSYYNYPSWSAKYATLMGYDGTPVQDEGLEKSWVSDFAGANVALMELSQALFTNSDITKAKEILHKVTTAIVSHQQYFSNINGYAHSGVWSPTTENFNNYMQGSSTENFGAIWAIKMCQKYGVSTPEWDAMLPQIYMPWTKNASLGADSLYNGIFSDPAWVGSVEFFPSYWLTTLGETATRAKSNYASVIKSENFDYFFNRGWASAVASKLNLADYSKKYLSMLLNKDSLSDDTNFIECNSANSYNVEDYKRSLELGAHGAYIMAMDQMLLNSDSDTTLKIFPSMSKEWETLGTSFWQLQATGGLAVSGSYTKSGTTATINNTSMTSSGTRDVLIRVPAGTTSAVDSNSGAVVGIVDGNFAKVTITLSPNETKVINIVPSFSGSGLTSFTKEFPENNSIGVTNTNPIFSWQSSNTASSYTLVISTNSDLSSPIYNVNVGNTTFHKTSLELLTGVRYYWKVTANCNSVKLDSSGENWKFISAGRAESDYFSGNWINPKWNARGNCSVVSDKLKINIPASSNDTSNMILQSVEINDFTIMTKLDFKPTSNYLQAGLIIYQDDANYIKLSREFNATNRYELSGPYVSGGVIVNDSIKTETAYLKLVKSGNNYTSYQSSDGYNWLQIGGVATATLTSPKIGLFGSSWSGSSAVAFADWVYINETCSSVLLSAPPVSFDYYNVSDDKIITNVDPNTLKNTFVNDSRITVRNDTSLSIKKGTTILNFYDRVSTGTTVDVNVSSVFLERYTIIIYGDVNGDGSILVDDLAKIKQHLLKSSLLSGLYKSAGDLSKKGNISISDLLSIKKHILGIKLIYQ